MFLMNHGRGVGNHAEVVIAFEQIQFRHSGFFNAVPMPGHFTFGQDAMRQPCRLVRDASTAANRISPCLHMYADSSIRFGEVILTDGTAVETPNLNYPFTSNEYTTLPCTS